MVSSADAAPGERLLRELGVADSDDERAVAVAVCRRLDRETELKKRPVDDPELVQRCAPTLAALEAWIVARKSELETRWLALQPPKTLPDALHLVHIRRPGEAMPELLDGPVEGRRERDGFRLTDRRMSGSEALAQVDYCLYCHDRDKDSCSKGLHDKEGKIKPNALGVPLDGCPLDEKISEMHLLKRRGDSVGALALVCVDNPMLPGTGHRICNDCMKSCVYQKQEPVNIPQIETAVLTDVLWLPWGFEIYGLLTRWNPLNVRRPYPLPYRGKDVLVVGLGPAGYTLAHHLLNEGFGVAGIDGLKLEPLPDELLQNPVRDFSQLYVELDERVLAGFGGVSEYGITVRWDKNFLTVVYATLMRRDKFRAYGGVRFGGTVTLDDALARSASRTWRYAVGAGKPTIIELENNLIRGVRKASDFLMALQLTGAYKRSSLTNLQVRLPALVIGGGLTAIDTATELLAYYVVQAEKTLERYERLVAQYGDRQGSLDRCSRPRGARDPLRGDRSRAQAPRRARRRREGGAQATVSAAARFLGRRGHRLSQEADRLPRLSSQPRRGREVPGRGRALRRGAVAGAGGAGRARRGQGDGVQARLGRRIDRCRRARSAWPRAPAPIPFTKKSFPVPSSSTRKDFLRRISAISDESGIRVEPDSNGFFTSYNKDGKTVSYYGDNHPRFAGSVVKAMASAKYGFLQVAALFGRYDVATRNDLLEERWRQLARTLDEELRAVVVAVNRLTPTIVEVVVKAPLAARRFHPGQFYRLQNYETHSEVIDGTRLSMEGLALTGAWTDAEKGLLSLIVLEMGGSSRLCAALKPGEPVVVMGPTGSPTEIPHGETVLLAGGGLGNAVLFSIGKALRAAGCRVVYFAAYRKREDVFKIEDIEAAADEVIWSVDAGPPIQPRRPQDKTRVGNVVQPIQHYAEGDMGGGFRLSEVSRIIAIGSDRMMRAMRDARHGVLAPHLNPNHAAVASINSPMQCMMKEVCAQCLQKHVDPSTGKEHIIFSCFNQDQPMDWVDFNNLAARLRANSLQEKLTNLWLEQAARRARPSSRIKVSCGGWRTSRPGSASRRAAIRFRAAPSATAFSRATSPSWRSCSATTASGCGWRSNPSTGTPSWGGWSTSRAWCRSG